MTEKELGKGFWTTVKKILKDKQIPRKQFCSEIGIKEKTLSAMICRSTCPDIYLLTKIRNVLKCHTDFLLYSFNAEYMELSLSDKEKDMISFIHQRTLSQQAVILDTIIAVLNYTQNPYVASIPSPSIETSFSFIPVRTTEEPETQPEKKRKKSSRSRQVSHQKNLGQTFFEGMDSGDNTVDN